MPISAQTVIKIMVQTKCINAYHFWKLYILNFNWLYIHVWPEIDILWADFLAFYNADLVIIYVSMQKSPSLACPITIELICLYQKRFRKIYEYINT